MLKCLFFAGLFALRLCAQQPAVASVVNAGSYAVAGLPNAPIAQGSLFIVFGTSLGPDTLQGAPSFPLSTSLAGTSISVMVNGTTTQAIMIYSRADQVAAVLPSRTPSGTGTLTLTYNGRTSSPLPVQVVANSFGIFTLNQGGSGTAVILDGAGSSITPLNPAAPGETVAIWGTGLGAITSDETQPPPQLDMQNVPVEVYVGTVKANVSYRGRTGFAGVDQINFQIPPGQLGCSVTVAVKIKNVVSNFTSLAVSSGGPCSDPGGYPAGALDLAATKGSLDIGGFALMKVVLPAGAAGNATPIMTETADVAFNHHTAASLSQNPSSLLPSVGGCLVNTFSSAHLPVNIPLQGLDAGLFLTLTGANGMKQLPKAADTKGTYFASVSQSTGPPYLNPGAYTFTGTGGADIGAFTVTSMVGEPLIWSNQAAISKVDRSQDLTVTWTGGPADGYALISGGSTQVVGTTRYQGLFYCLAPVEPKQFTIPSVVLLALPPTTVTATQTMGTLNVGSFTATMVPAPPGIDLATTDYMQDTSSFVSYQ